MASSCTKGVLDWLSEFFFHTQGCKTLEQASQEKSPSVEMFKKRVDPYLRTWFNGNHSSGAKLQLDSMILKEFSNLNYSVIPMLLSFGWPAWIILGCTQLKDHQSWVMDTGALENVAVPGMQPGSGYPAGFSEFLMTCAYTLDDML